MYYCKYQMVITLSTPRPHKWAHYYYRAHSPVEMDSSNRDVAVCVCEREEMRK